MKRSNALRIVLATACILMIPLAAMQFTNDVDWKLADFLIIGVLLLGTGFTYELVAHNMKNVKHKAILALVLGAALFLVWAELAVGIFGTPFAGS